MIPTKLIYCLYLLAYVVNCDDIFSSTEVIKRLFEKEQKLLKTFQETIVKEEKRLENLKKFSEKLSTVLKKVNKETIDAYIGNPVNAFSTIWRLSNEWKLLHEHLNKPQVKEFNKVYADNSMPSNEDTEGAIDAILKLQNFYQISSRDMMKGRIPGIKQKDTTELNFRHIYEIGKRAYDVKDWALQKEWFELANELMGSRDEMEGIKKVTILDLLSFSEYSLGNFEKAINITYDLIKLSPDDQRFHTNINNFKSWLEATEEIQTNFVGKPKSELQILYESLCRGEVRKQTLEEIKEMKCWYEKSHPDLRYKPQKMEKIWTNPDILILRNILFDTDMEKLKEITKFQLKRAGLHGISYSNSGPGRRTSKNAWLKIDSYDFLHRMAKRAEAITKLNMKAAEKLQVGNYGIGGHYGIHFDWAKENEDKFSQIGMGNRIATLLYYISDVESGGATVFTMAQTAVFPSKGDAVFWMNLKRNGEGDVMTAHAGCPVLVGSKWVANWWIHEFGQEFRKPCLLDPEL